MKKNFFLSILFSFTAGCIMYSCSEVTKIEAEQPEPPTINDFTPKSGKARTEIKIWGENLSNVNKVTIGDIESGIKYRLTNDTIIVYPLPTSKTGKIKLINAYGETESDEIFTMEYPVPTLSNVPANGKVGDEILIEGENLNSITGVKFGNSAATITYQSDKEIIIVIPSDVPDNGTKISFSYFNGENTTSIESETIFSPTKPDPVFDEEKPSEGSEGTAIVFTGQNLHVIDKVIMNNDTELTIAKSETSISVTLPQVDRDTQVTLQAIYYGNKTMEIVSGFTIKDTKYYAHKNILLGARESGLQSFFNAITGEAFTACDIAGMGSLAENDKFHLYIDYSSSTLIFGNPNSGANKFKNFKCDGTALETTGAKNIVKYYPVEDTNYKEQIINANENDLITIFSMNPKDIVDTLKGENSSTSDFKYPEWNTTDKNVILFVLYDSEEQPEKIGFIHALKTSELEAKDMSKTSSVTFNCYFQK